MTLLQWFDFMNPDHRAAYKHLNDTGIWPEGFLPKDIEIPRGWNYYLMSKAVDVLLTLAIVPEGACPFCASTDVGITSNGIDQYSVECNCCGAQGPTGQSEADARVKWVRS